ncbi:ABC transporter permease [Thiohalorhabdus denitrificans]|uniref:Putative ABC transport system permease protein n=1 Tax=Thiohalorhabdus denitrificans TaxID=381306 RepID=A0A1G5HZC8_9GAMM|nr:FtsX-like permease family protein [Thiohalorhabdus denitrificans]SCY68418.1 putative ABC transport system permease protein [Thiohalorhabdus denitrificans]
MIRALRFALRALPRDLRSREMRVLAAALVVAVGALSAVGFFTDRVDRALAQRATDLLGADLVVEADAPLGANWRDKAADLGLRTAGYLTFPSVVVAGERTELVAVKAVGPGYPLRGAARLSEVPYGQGTPTASIPERGSLWLDPRLFARLGVEVGDRMPLGQTELKVAASLAYEPDRGGSLFQLAPRVMLNRADLPDTGLVTPASRVAHHLLVAGPPEAVAAFRQWAEGRDRKGVELQGVESARPEMRVALDRAESFLGLAAVMAVMLAGAAVAVAVHAFSAREADSAALMRCFGAPLRLVEGSLLLRLLVVGLLASGIGVGVGWLAQNGLVALVGAWFGDRLPPPSLVPAFTGLAAGVVTLVGFGLVPALRIRRVPVLRVLRREAAAPEPSAIAAALLAVAAVGGLIFYQAGDAALAGWVLAGILGLLGALGGAAWLLLRVVGRFRGRAVGGWRFGLANLARRRGASTVQLAGFGLGLLALLLLAVVRVDVLRAWERDIPPKAPNQFMINIQPDQVGEVRKRLREAGIRPEGFYPMSRGRLVAVNGESVSPGDFEAGRARRLAEREFNLSWAETPRPDYEVAAGEWWSPQEAASSSQLSVETGIAEDLGIALGDRLTFRVAGERVTGKVTNLRRVDWESFKVNFFVIATPAALEGAPATWITSYWAPPDSAGAIARLVRANPGITVLDVGSILDRVRSTIAQGARAVEYVFAFSLLAGIIVLVAAIQASRDERRVEIALLRTLGASSRRLRAILAAEFAAIGVLAGLLAAGGAGLIGWAVSTQVLELPYTFNPWLLVLGMGGGALGITAAGLAATRGLRAERPLVLLRNRQG